MSSPTKAQLHDVYHKYNFVLSINGIDVAGFQKVSGLKQEVDVIEYREGNNNIWKRKMPGLAKFDSITCERGMTISDSSWNFMKKYIDGGKDLGGDKNGPMPSHDPIRTVATMTVLDRSGADMKTWALHDCWISEWSFDDLDATQNEVLLEKIVLVYEYFVLS